MNRQNSYFVVTSNSMDNLVEDVSIAKSKLSWRCVGGPVVWNDANGKQQFSQAIVLD